MPSQKSVSLILPVYNERALLSPAVKRMRSVFDQVFDDYEILLIDDGSTDGTGDEMLLLANSDARIKVVQNYINLNIGVSIQRGFACAGKEWVIFDSIDLPLTPDDIPPVIERLADFDLLVLEREEYRGATTWRKITSRINYWLLRLLFPKATWGFRDLNYTLAFRKAIWPMIKPLAKSPAFSQPEMILRALYAGLRVGKLKMSYHARSVRKGSLGKPHDIIWSVYDMFRFRIKTLFA